MNQPENSQLTYKSDGLYYTASTLTFRINKLTGYNLDRLKVTLRASTERSQTVFHIDTLDLYYSRAREGFAESCVKYLHVEMNVVLSDLSELITVLEKERISQREGKNQIIVPVMTESEKKEALELLRSKDLLKQIVSAFDSIGYIGERNNKLLGYIATISRLQPDPLALLILSRSGAGKTCLQDAVCKFVPPEYAIQYTRLTGQSLFYCEENELKNKVLAIEEEEGMQDAMYSVKTLISSQKLSVSATRTDSKTGKFSSDAYKVKGPVVVMVSTTNPDALDDETKQRFMILTIDESPEQTKNILYSQLNKNMHDWYEVSNDESSILRIYHTMNRLLEPLTVTFTRDLKIIWPYSRLQMRREQQKFVSLVKAITLLHQYQRKRGTMQRIDGTTVEYVQTSQQDIDLALELGKAVFCRNIDDLSPTARTLLSHIIGYVNKKRATMQALEHNHELLLSEVPFTRKELRQCNGWSDTQVTRNIEQLVHLGYVGKISGRQGSTFRYLLIDDGSADPVFYSETEEEQKST